LSWKEEVFKIEFIPYQEAAANQPNLRRTDQVASYGSTHLLAKL